MSTLKLALPRAESELGRNRDQKGDNSYYYAHSEGWEVPENAKIRAGPGLVNGGAPVKLGPDGQPLGGGYQPAEGSSGAQDEVVSELRRRVEELEHQLVQARAGVKPIPQFSFSDEGAKCKVYVEVGQSVLERRTTLETGAVVYTEAAITVTFSGRSCAVRLSIPDANGVVERRAVTLVGCSDIIPEKCTYKVDRAKGRITLSFVKQDIAKKWSDVKPQQ
eukprot:TRINITY_DN9829_c0_g1_i2.p1 TRINITY_DN9829_c0_g1~~TRINITY_DN9829_c0_g1_i2.p1  ORF type:complete len:220 (+),score=27.35 TRINITY_DN9829_c0_g1_i2:241-900(+)